MSTSRRTFIFTGAAIAASTTIAALRPRVFAGGSDGDLGPGDLRELRKRFGARVFLRGDAEWEAVRKIRNRDFDGVHPRAVVFARTVEDVRDAIGWARAAGVAVVPRGGAHSYTGQSTTEGLVISLVHMAETQVDKAAMTAEIGAGAILADVNVGLLKADVGLPTGSCPSVGVAGLTLGGGIGFSSRKWGLMCDNLTGVTVVMADGRVVVGGREPGECAETLWMHQGGGGGQFGIVTSLRFGVHPVEPISQYSVKWPWRDADRVLKVWQELATAAPDELFSVCMLARGKTEPQILSHGRYFGSPAALKRLLEPLLGVAKPLKAPQIYASTMWKSHVTAPDCWPDPSVCHSWNHPQPGRYKQASYSVKSDYFDRLFSDDARAELIRGIEGIQKQRIQWGGIILDALGGAIGRPAPGDTAWVHRKNLIQAEYVAHWGASTPSSAVAANRAWLREFYAAMRPHASGECYQNYPDLDRKDWAAAYYGGNLERLKRCKAAIDPSGLFRGPQSLADA